MSKSKTAIRNVLQLQFLIAGWKKQLVACRLNCFLRAEERNKVGPNMRKRSIKRLFQCFNAEQQQEHFNCISIGTTNA